MKNLLFAALAAITTYMGASAEGRVYTYSDSEGFPAYGSMRRVSPNGKWAAGGDYNESTGCFIVNTSNPESLIWDNYGEFLDIDNNGMAVGANYEIEGYAKYQRAAIYKDGEWTRLPLPESVLGRSYAIAVSADSRLICGHVMCASGDQEDDELSGGKYYPIVWELDDASGAYKIKKVYNNLYLPGTYGFYVYDMSPDGRWICGIQCLNMGDFISALLDTETGELKIWHDITFEMIKFQYLDKWYENEVMKVDGIIDECDTFGGMFLYATNQYIFGSRDIVTDVNEDGTGTVLHVATAYDTETGTFHDGRSTYSYLCGLNPQENFTTSGIINYISDGDPFYLSVDDYLLYEAGIEDAPAVDGVYDFDSTSKVLAGSHLVENGVGEMLESPVLVILDQPIFTDATGIADIRADRPGASVKVDGTRISVAGANSVAIYSAGGALVSNAHTADVTPGVYVVIADGKSHKVAIKK